MVIYREGGIGKKRIINVNVTMINELNINGIILKMITVCLQVQRLIQLHIVHMPAKC